MLIEKHGLPENPTYNLTNYSVSEILDNHKSGLTSFGTQTSNEELEIAIHLLDSKDAQKFLKTPSHCGFIEVFDQASIHCIHKIAYTY